MTTILEAAGAIVDGDREQTYGDPGRNLRTIADLWDSWLLARGYSGPGLTTDDVACLMVLLKMARLANNPEHRDSQVDACGYLRLMEKLQEAQKADGGLQFAMKTELMDRQQMAELMQQSHEAVDETAGIREVSGDEYAKTKDSDHTAREIAAMMKRANEEHERRQAARPGNLPPVTFTAAEGVPMHWDYGPSIVRPTSNPSPAPSMDSLPTLFPIADED